MSHQQSTCSFADAATGLFTGRVLVGSQAVIAANIPPGCVAVPGRHDHLCRRLDTATGAVVPYQPPAPAADEWRTWAWDEAAERWLPVATDAARARDLRVERDRRIAAVEWRYVRHAREARLGLPLSDDLQALDTYVQALADLTDQPTFPAAVTWPDAPQG